MRATYGAEYERYRAAVPGWIPRLQPVARTVTSSKRPLRALPSSRRRRSRPAVTRHVSIASVAAERDFRVAAQTRRIGAGGSVGGTTTSGAERGQGEVRQERDAEARGDVALKHVVVVRLEADPRLEAGVAARAGDDQAAGARAAAAEPVLIGQVGHLDASAIGEWMVERQGDVHRLGQEKRVLDVPLVRLRDGRIVERDRHVELSGAKARHRDLGLGVRDRSASPSGASA